MWKSRRDNRLVIGSFRILARHETYWFEKSFCPSLKRNQSEKYENQFTLYEPLNHSIHTVSSILMELFDYMKENKENDQLLKVLREMVRFLSMNFTNIIFLIGCEHDERLYNGTE